LILALTALAASPSRASTPLKRFDRNRISFNFPSTWFVTTRPLSKAGNPVYRFAVSSVSVRRTASDVGPCLPGVARQVPKDGVLAYLREALGSDRTRSLPRMPRRPRGFRLPTAGDNALCGFAGRGRWIPFKDAGRAFYLGVYVGPKASAAARRGLKSLLDQMKIEPR
jgi:hypothetical protein